MSQVETEFLETTADLKVESLPLSHVSVEIGHLYMEDFVDGVDAVQRTFAAAAPWAQAARNPQAIGCDKKSVRVSTCFLIDDYFSRFSTPAVVIPMVLAAAEREGVEIDYLARESACASANGMSPATLTLGSLVTEPVPGTTGGRPPLTETGWLTNGQRSPSASREEAMARRVPWQPPQESARRRHSIFVDVELWDEHDGQRTWSCPMLAAVWQLMRLGLLRDHGRPVVTPQQWTDPCFPDSWDDLPPVIGLKPKAAAFAAYTTLSVLSPRFLPVELAVRTILSQFACDSYVFAEATGRAKRDAMQPPAELVDRIRYVFAAPGDTDPS
ncbi:MAG TPA: SCO2522 family protein [Trebonia sp.]|nr:SCO2522 family protein [Trebonia sp.]